MTVLAAPPVTLSPATPPIVSWPALPPATGEPTVLRPLAVPGEESSL